MNILLVKADELQGNSKAILTGARARYVYDFHALKPGLSIKAGLLNGLVGQALVEQVSMSQVVLSINFDNAPLMLNQLEIILALTRPQILKKVLGLVCELGVNKITLVSAARSQKSYLSSHILRPDELEYFMIKGLEQSGSTLLPKLSIESTLDAALQTINSTAKLRFLAHADEGAYETPQSSSVVGLDSSLKISNQDNVVLAIGPESGWSEEEVAKFYAHDFKQVFLGQRILRVDTAVAFLAGQVAQMRQAI